MDMMRAMARIARVRMSGASVEREWSALLERT